MKDPDTICALFIAAVLTAAGQQPARRQHPGQGVEGDAALAGLS